MKKIIILCFVLLVHITCICQEKQFKISDSTVAEKSLTTIKSTISLAPEQEKIILQALMKETEQKREAANKYWKSPEFYTIIQRATYLRDSIVREVLGHEKYMQFEMEKNKRRIEFERAQKIIYDKGIDSFQNKSAGQ